MTMKERLGASLPKERPTPSGGILKFNVPGGECLLFRSLAKNMVARHAQLKLSYGPYGFFAESETPVCNHS